MRKASTPSSPRGGPVSVVLAGLGGMGAVYLDALLELHRGGGARLAGAADPRPERCPKLDVLRDLRIPVFSDLESFFAGETAELAVISTPHHFHARQTILALSDGCQALCEKPLAAAIQDVWAIKEAERRTGRWVAVGYQWSFNPAFQELKKDIMSGLFGRPRRMRCLYLWPREFAYYARNGWAGRLRDDRGAWILDGPAQNAMAHDLHNMFYLLGETTTASARPAFVTAELYRAYPIENNDTAAARIKTEGGVEIVYLVTHVPEEERGPVCDFEFERGTVRMDGRTGPVRARWANGKSKEYGIPDADLLRKLRLAVEGVRTGERPLCGSDAAESQVLCVNGIQDSAAGTVPFPPGLVREVGEGPARRLAVEGLDRVLRESFDSWRLPAEIGIPWARAGATIDLESYRGFPSRP